MKFVSPRVKALAAVAAAAMLLVACGGGGDNNKTVQLGPLSANDHGTKDATNATTLSVEVDSFYFEPSFIHGSAGQKLKLTLENESNTLHNFSLTSQSIEKDVPPKGNVEVDVTFPQSGAALFFCKYHTGSGMNGELLVGDATPQAVSAAASQPPPSSSTPSAGSTPAAAAAPSVKVSDSSLGKIVTDASGRTVYTFKNDVVGSGKSAVAGQLATVWPPLTLASGNPAKPADLSGELTLITRDDGTKQIAYKGMPLYYFAQDTAPGDTKGQGIGNVWFVATP
jgi:predicted lipoprotein with Yx(FWY)xxD motif/plastocyanin